jgi:hypothetical protein
LYVVLTDEAEPVILAMGRDWPSRL